MLEPGKVTPLERPLRLAVAGVTHGHLWEVVRRIPWKEFEIVGVWEADGRYLKDNGLRGQVNDACFYQDLGQMLDETRPEAVVAYGSIHDHLQVVEACAPRGIHVMVEKPLATTVKEARRMAELSRRYGIMVLTNYETSWYAANHEVKRLVDEDAVGAVRRINVYDGHQGPFEIGCGKAFTDWLTDPVGNGGGAVMDFGCYGANLATWLLRNERPLSVQAVLKQHKKDKYSRVDDDATILVNYPHATVQIMASWCWPMNRKDMYVYGDRGYLYQKTADEMEVLLPGAAPAARRPQPLPSPYDDSFRYLRAAVRGHISVEPSDLASIDNNLLVVEILNAAIKSHKKGRTVKM
ncbi:MAG: Gfo/Idh/MocA family oxidoreductase [Prevotella sp.]|nr:Gfo/Idh/MocA family oxidoreductase [Prevotella sp.]